MKIISQTQDQIRLKDGNTSGIITGLVLLVIGVLVLCLAIIIYHSGNDIIVSAIIFFFSFLALFKSSAITVTIDKKRNAIVYFKKRIIKTESQTYNVDAASRVEFRTYFQKFMGSRTTMPYQTLKYRAVIVLKDGNVIPLENEKFANNRRDGSNELTSNSQKELNIASLVANFINVPLQESEYPADSSI